MTAHYPKPDRCDCPGCNREPTTLTFLRDEIPPVTSRRNQFVWLCDLHVDSILHEDTHPDHIVACPNCGCNFAVHCYKEL